MRANRCNVKLRWLPFVFCLSFVILLGADGGGCSQPGVVGVQDYGNVTGRVLDATTNRPIANALVSVGSLFTTTSDAKGAFVLPRVPIGRQTVTVRDAGYRDLDVTVLVTKDETASLGYTRLVPIAMPRGLSTLPPPPLPSPTASAAPSPAPTPTPKSL
jgi:hypothetical protein